MSLSAAGLAAELALARAGCAARRGALEDAEHLLREVSVPTPAVLDLQARICAQRGALAAADGCWAQLQQLDPGHAGAAEGRRVIARKGSRARRVGRAAFAAACVVAVVATVWIGVLPSSPVVAPPVAGPAVQQPADPAALRVAAVQGLARELAMPGIRLETHPDHVRVIFEHGLFAGSDRLTPSGAQTLAALGRRLAGRTVSTTVIGHTVTVPGGPTSGGSVVALARALVAARELAEVSGLPLTSFTLVSADQRQAPFPDAPDNRTVILLVQP